MHEGQERAPDHGEKMLRACRLGVFVSYNFVRPPKLAKGELEPTHITFKDSRHSHSKKLETDAQ